ncbi:50S ribosomal protein L15 [bacterium]|nr:50S ribosomal protein L15 [bacterium]MCP5463262.1 50S ribosomal protein L15 [bacterium]
MKLSDLRPNEGAKKSSIRVGRGNGSRGKTAGRGVKGQKSRSGYSQKIGHEGGQMPLQRRLPKRGFNNKIFKVQYSIINVEELNRIENDSPITPQFLVENNYIKQYKGKLKVLGDGDIEKALEVHAHKFSKSAMEKIKSAKGTCQVLE